MGRDLLNRRDRFDSCRGALDSALGGACGSEEEGSPWWPDPRTLGADCSNCPLASYGPPVHGEGPTDAKIAIIGESPGYNEQYLMRPFLGRAGEALENYLTAVGLTRLQVYLDHALMCMPPGMDLEAFKRTSKREAKVAGMGPRENRCTCEAPAWNQPGGPSVIIPVGNAALKSLSGLEGITNWRGSPLEF